ncbi:MAG: ATP-grasp domain-containing protein [Ruminococcus sp.]|nr:ATP-grasp domain-containing protein [Ruminococcus sp.]
MDKVLITGGSHAELPLIDALHRLGYYVISTGNNPDGLGHASADLYVQGDFSDRDLVLRLAEDYRVKGIVSGCNDFAFLSAAYACEKLGLPGHDSFNTANIIHHKDLFRELLRECGLPSPESIKVSSESELEAACQKIGFPMLVKPIDLTGGKGVRICSSINEAKRAFKAAMKATREDHVIAEHMIKGQNHGVSALIKNGRTVFAFFDNEEYYINKYLVSGAYAPADISDKVKADVCSQINTIAGKLSLEDGLFHCQCIMTDDGISYLIDPCRRAPGDLYLKLVEYSTGVDHSEAIVRSELGLDFSELLANRYDTEKCIARECIMTDHCGTFKGIAIDDELEKYIRDALIWAEPGEPVEDYLKYKAGIVFFEFPDRSIMKNMLDGLYDKMKIITENNN